MWVKFSCGSGGFNQKTSKKSWRNAHAFYGIFTEEIKMIGKEDAEKLVRGAYPVKHLAPIELPGGWPVFENKFHLYTACPVRRIPQGHSDGRHYAEAFSRMILAGGEIMLEGHRIYRLIDNETVEALDGSWEAGKEMMRTIDDKTILPAVVRVPKTRNAAKALADITSLIEYGVDSDGNHPPEPEDLDVTSSPETGVEAKTV